MHQLLKRLEQFQSDSVAVKSNGLACLFHSICIADVEKTSGRVIAAAEMHFKVTALGELLLSGCVPPATNLLMPQGPSWHGTILFQKPRRPTADGHSTYARKRN